VPVVDLKVGVLSTGAFAPIFVAQGRGHFRDLVGHLAWQ
jgi:hypothetical protein